MSPRLTDWSIALTAAIAFTSGLVSLLSGLPLDWFIFVLHGIAGFWLLLLLGSVAIWPAQQLTEQALHLPGARQRFTGSREMGSYAGNAFPTTSWVADAPRLLDVQTWRLALGGAVTTPRDFSYDELVAAGDVLEATLDCTGGFYSTQRWRGIRTGG